MASSSDAIDPYEAQNQVRRRLAKNFSGEVRDLRVRMKRAFSDEAPRLHVDEDLFASFGKLRDVELRLRAVADGDAG